MWRAAVGTVFQLAEFHDKASVRAGHRRVRLRGLGVPELAHYPHVGVRLGRDEAARCLQTWNVTFVFNEDAAAPRLTAVVYDQWECERDRVRGGQ